MDGAAATAYVESNLVDFGWHTNDNDNTWQTRGVLNSPIFSAWPWTGVIRKSDMTLAYDEPDTTYLDIYNIAIELAAE